MPVAATGAGLSSFVGDQLTSLQTDLDRGQGGSMQTVLALAPLLSAQATASRRRRKLTIESAGDPSGEDNAGRAGREVRRLQETATIQGYVGVMSNVLSNDAPHAISEANEKLRYTKAVGSLTGCHPDYQTDETTR